VPGAALLRRHGPPQKLACSAALRASRNPARQLSDNHNYLAVIHVALSIPSIRAEAMSNRFSRWELFKRRKSRKGGKLEVQNGRFPLEGPGTPPVVSEAPECDTKTSIAPEPSWRQNPSVATSVD
jgi:hypothetical protein